MIVNYEILKNQNIAFFKFFFINALVVASRSDHYKQIRIIFSMLRIH